MVEYAADNGIRCAARRFGLSRNTIRTWRDRMKSDGVGGLVPRYPGRRPRRIDPNIVDLVIVARKSLRPPRHLNTPRHMRRRNGMLFP